VTKISLILGCNGISVLVVILHYNFVTSSSWGKGVISFYYSLQLNMNLQLFKDLIDKNFNEFTFTLRFSFVCYIFMTSWNSRFTWSCPKLPVQLYLPNKPNLHCSPYKTWTFPFYFYLWPEHLSCFILFRSSSMPNDCRCFFCINLDIFCTFYLLFLWFCIHFSFFLLDVSIERAGAFIFMRSK